MHELETILLQSVVGLSFGLVTYVAYTYALYHTSVILSSKQMPLMRIFKYRVLISIGIIFTLVMLSNFIARSFALHFVPFWSGVGTGAAVLLFRKKPNYFYALFSEIWLRARFGINPSKIIAKDDVIAEIDKVRLRDLYLLVLWMKETHGLGKRDWEKTGIFAVDFQFLLDEVPETFFDAKIADNLELMGFRI